MKTKRKTGVNDFRPKFARLKLKRIKQRAEQYLSQSHTKQGI